MVALLSHFPTATIINTIIIFIIIIIILIILFIMSALPICLRGGLSWSIDDKKRILLSTVTVSDWRPPKSSATAAAYTISSQIQKKLSQVFVPQNCT